MTLKSVPPSMNRAVVGQASRLPPRRLAPGFVAGETPAKTAGTAAPLLPRPCSWSQCAQSMAWGLSTHEIRLRCSKPSPERPGESSESKAQEKLQVKRGSNPQRSHGICGPSIHDQNTVLPAELIGNTGRAIGIVPPFAIHQVTVFILSHGQSKSRLPLAGLELLQLDRPVFPTAKVPSQFHAAGFGGDDAESHLLFWNFLRWHRCAPA